MNTIFKSLFLLLFNFFFIFPSCFDSHNAFKKTASTLRKLFFLHTRSLISKNLENILSQKDSYDIIRASFFSQKISCSLKKSYRINFFEEFFAASLRYKIQKHFCNDRYDAFTISEKIDYFFKCYKKECQKYTSEEINNFFKNKDGLLLESQNFFYDYDLAHINCYLDYHFIIFLRNIVSLIKGFSSKFNKASYIDGSVLEHIAYKSMRIFFRQQLPDVNREVPFFSVLYEVTFSIMKALLNITGGDNEVNFLKISRKGFYHEEIYLDTIALNALLSNSDSLNPVKKCSFRLKPVNTYAYKAMQNAMSGEIDILTAVAGSQEGNNMNCVKVPCNRIKKALVFSTKKLKKSSKLTIYFRRYSCNMLLKMLLLMVRAGYYKKYASIEEFFCSLFKKDLKLKGNFYEAVLNDMIGRPSYPFFTQFVNLQNKPQIILLNNSFFTNEYIRKLLSRYFEKAYYDVPIVFDKYILYVYHEKNNKNYITLYDLFKAYIYGAGSGAKVFNELYALLDATKRYILFHKK